jgi:phospholipid/cholesterol/gamma-HCH transport system ATP-binding protein
MTDQVTHKPPKSGAPNGQAIVVQGLEKTLRGSRVLDGIDLDVGTGETVVVVGASGSGKSVLLKNIVGLMQPDAGSVLLLGQEITKFRAKEWAPLRSRVGMVFQSSALFDSLTVEENVALGVRVRRRLADNEEKALVREKLGQVGLEGIEGVKPASLSGGMKKRVALARALATEPEILLYDEPTTGLDPIMSDVINRLIRDLQGRMGLTSVVVTHDMKSAYYVGDRIALLHHGKVHVFDTPEAIRATQDLVVRAFIEGQSRLARAGE